MTDHNTQDDPTTPESGSQPDGRAEQPDTKAPEEKLLTQAEVNAIVAREKAKATRAAREALEAERKKAEMTEAERYKAELEERDKRIQALEAERTRATRTAALAGKVTDTEYALWKLEQAGDKYLTDDGVDVDAFLKDHPSLKAQPDPKPGPAPTTAGGGGARAVDMNAAIRKAAGRA